MDEGHKTALAFLGIFAFLGLAIFFQADISSIVEGPSDQASEPEASQNENNESGTVQASTEYTDTFEGELGSEYVFDIETVSIERQDSRNGRLYYKSALNFELTEFGEQVLQASNNEEVRNLVQERFTDYPKREGFEEDLINDVEAVNDNRIEDIPVQALTGNLESIENSENADAEIIVSFEEGERPEIKWGSFSTVWSMDVESASTFVQVQNCSDLQSMRNNLSENYQLSNNINCSGFGDFESIGDSDNRFEGHFNGSGHIISGLSINEGSDTGLFGGISESSTVERIGLKNITVSGGLYTGGLVGWNNGEIRQSFVREGSVSGSSQLGGLTGFNQYGEVYDSYSMVQVNGTDNTRIGGLVGRGGGAYRSYSTGKVIGSDGYDSGGLMGDGTATDSYWDVNSSSQSGSSGGEGLMTSEMVGTPAEENLQGFDFEAIWDSVSCYPRLAWENQTNKDLPWNGCGEGNVPYEIGSCDDLRAINEESLFESSYKLTDSISCSGSDFQPIADSDQFSGVFDGAGRSIEDLSIDDGSYSALFAETSDSSIVRDIQLKNADINGGYYSATLIGWNRGEVHAAAASGNVEADEQIGGLIGLNDGGIINNSYSGVAVNGSSDRRIGGLVGRQLNNGAVENSYSYGRVYGQNNYDSGGLVGDGGTVGSSYWDTEASGQSSSAGGTSLTTDQMNGSSASSNMNGLDFQNTWKTVQASDEKAKQDGYPILQSLDTENQLEAQNVLESLIGSIVISNSEGVVSTDGFGVVQTR
ncbi:MAG: hypothetical protein R6V35_02830 [Candidatus Nanohaloarchaea archaeon]